MASILLLEPYDTGSHAAWMRGYRRHSTHRVDILSLPGQWWQWRMQGGAVSLARLFNASFFDPDLIVASDMLDLTTFLALTRQRTAHTPTAVYFHENQLTYPPGPRIKRDLKIGFINYASALAADAVFFNSDFHRRAFLDELPRLLKHYPDYNELHTVEQIGLRARTLPIGMDLRALDAFGPKPEPGGPVILWNHRWEYDKNPGPFFRALDQLAATGVAFEVIIAGAYTGKPPELFEAARARLGARVIHYGFAPDLASYARLLWRATHAVSCAWQDFFGISMCEAMYCGCLPLMPRRLNYPALLPPAYHDMCLYEEGGLAAALRRTLHMPAPPEIRAHVAGLDWSVLAPLYDCVFEEVIEARWRA
jgi:glycosyltransferase involved in cell wall biosynthesis